VVIMNLDVTTDVTERAWDEFVRAQPDASGYHLWRWRRVFERAFGHRTVYAAAIENGNIVGVLPAVVIRSWIFGRFAVSLPFVNYGGILARSDGAARALLAHAGRLAESERARHLELRHASRRFHDLPAREHKVGMTMPLAATSASAWEQLDRKVRNQIKKAQKSELTADTGGVELLDDFYAVFAENMRDLGTPVHPREFFRAVLEECAGDARVFRIRLGSQPIAAAIGYRFRSTLEIPWASSLRAHRALCPNNLLYWAAIEHAIGARCTTFDFGRSTPGEGTFQFKSQWGAEPTPLAWEYVMRGDAALPDQSPRNPKFKHAIAVWKRLPVSLATWLGPGVMRSIPG